MTQSFSEEENYLQPVSSLLGLMISIGSSLTPIIKNGFVYSLFLNKDLAVPSSALSFVTSFLFIWVSSNYKHINLDIGARKDRGRGFYEPQFRINTNSFLVILSIIVLIIGWLFIFLSKFSEFIDLAYLQSLLYILFFTLLSSIFSILFSNARDMSQYREERRNFSLKIQELLERNGLLGKTTEILENRLLTPEEGNTFKVPHFSTKKIVVSSEQREKKVIELLISVDGEEIIKKIESK